VSSEVERSESHEARPREQGSETPRPPAVPDRPQMGTGLGMRQDAPSWSAAALVAWVLLTGIWCLAIVGCAIWQARTLLSRATQFVRPASTASAAPPAATGVLAQDAAHGTPERCRAEAEPAFALISIDWARDTPAESAGVFENNAGTPESATRIAIEITSDYPDGGLVFGEAPPRTCPRAPCDDNIRLHPAR
jgi:hypothetical protein